MEESLEAKQQFLREQILDKGYNPNDFFDFLMSKRGEDGTDLEKWSFIDLEYVVQEFMSTHQTQPPYSQQEQDYQMQQQQYQVDENGNYIQPQEQIPSEPQQPEPEDIFVECQRGETTEIGAHEDLVIKISE